MCSNSSQACTSLLSVVIPTRNEAANVKRCVRSFRGHPKSEAIEVIVVDNASNDATAELAREAGADVYTAGPERSAQRNFGALSVARGSYVLYMDADMSMPSETVDELLCLLAADDAPDLVYIPEELSGNGFWVRVRNWERGFYDLTPIDAFRVARRALLIKSGGFDETQTGTEDWDLDRRLRARTENFVLLDHPLKHHEPEASMWRLFRKKRYYAGHFDAYFRKWGRRDPLVRRQFGLTYRFFGVFFEHGKWRRGLRRPDFLLAVWSYKAVVGAIFCFSRVAKTCAGADPNPAPG